MLRLREDVRAVVVDGVVTGLERSGRVLALPTAIARSLLDRPAAGTPFLAGELGRVLRDHGFATDRPPPHPDDRNQVFVDALDADRDGRCAERLAEQEFVVLGCGGVGSNVAVALAALGARRMLLVDGDRVEPSNLNRLLWASGSAVGRPKASGLAEHLNARFGAAARPLDDWATDGLLRRAWDGDPRVRDGAVWVVAVDDARAARVGARFLHGRSAPYVHAGYIGARCVVGPFAAEPADPCAFCDAGARRPAAAGHLAPSAATHVAPSAAPNNQVVAAVLAAQLVRVVGLGPGATVLRGRRWVLDLVSGRARLVDIPKSTGCEVCS